MELVQECLAWSAPGRWWAEVALLVHSGLALCPCCELSDEPTDPLTDGRNGMILCWERRQWRVMDSLRPWQLFLAPCLWLCHLVSLLLPGMHRLELGGLGLEVGPASLESCSPVSPEAGRDRCWLHCHQELSHRAALMQGRARSCVMEAPRPSLNSPGLRTLKWRKYSWTEDL